MTVIVHFLQYSKHFKINKNIVKMAQVIGYYLSWTNMFSIDVFFKQLTGISLVISRNQSEMLTRITSIPMGVNGDIKN
jgi:hypothetical protein